MIASAVSPIFAVRQNWLTPAGPRLGPALSVALAADLGSAGSRGNCEVVRNSPEPFAPGVPLPPLAWKLAGTAILPKASLHYFYAEERAQHHNHHAMVRMRDRMQCYYQGSASLCLRVAALVRERRKWEVDH